MKKQYLSFSQRVQVYNFIKTVGKANNEHWIYNEGWNDERVAKQFSFTIGNVSTVRKELGKLKTYVNAPFSTKVNDLETRMAINETKLQMLEATIQKDHDTLVELYRKVDANILSTKFKVST